MREKLTWEEVYNTWKYESYSLFDDLSSPLTVSI